MVAKAGYQTGASGLIRGAQRRVTALLQAGGSKNAASLGEAARSALLVAGRGFEPLTFRL